MKECPKCQEMLHTVFASGRKNKYVCNECFYESEAFAPKKKTVKRNKTVYLDNWCYEGFDQYGQTFVISRAYSSKKKCEEAAQKEFNNMIGREGFKECTIIIWPASVQVKGYVINE